LKENLIYRLRVLTEEEEKIAGKFIQVGKQLEFIRKDLLKKLSRDPTHEEWYHLIEYGKVARKA
jgi:hypothetical protein